ncbi:hypothetical protein BS78_07G145500 [Paspalum vaginatum]|nr:hypothetical protein BS78_07G145500 [Paspalum vaginatum]
MAELPNRAPKIPARPKTSSSRLRYVPMSCTPNLSFLVSRVVSSLCVLFYPRQGGPPSRLAASPRDLGWLSAMACSDLVRDRLICLCD